MIVLDTSVLSLAFRRRGHTLPESHVAAFLRRLVAEDEPLGVPGIVLQELLSGVRTPGQFRRLRALMAGFPLLLANGTHHVRAAQISHACRRAGVSCSTVDALIAALTVAAKGRLFTTDVDFQHMAPHCGLRLLHAPAEAGA